MKSKQEYISILRQNAARLSDKYGIKSMKLFGSVARGEQREDSDVDLLVEMPPTFFNACAANDEIENLLGCKVDMIRKHANLSPLFIKHVNKDAITIF